MRSHDALAVVDVVGKFVRTSSVFRDIISPSHPIYQPEFGRYHLYVSLACPWANRCLAVLLMKGLSGCIKHTVVHPTWKRTRPNIPDDNHCGWMFYQSGSNVPVQSPAGYGDFSYIQGCESDPNIDALFVRDLYERSDDTLGKYTVPVLWDKKTSRIVNNESALIVRMLNTEFNEWTTGPHKDIDLYPPHLHASIDGVNDWVYTNINDGVYKCGFAKTQSAYDEAVGSLYTHLDRVEELLSRSRYLVGDEQITEADVRLFMTLVRFDEVYVVYFKCNVKRISDYPHMMNYMRELYQIEGIQQSIDMSHIKTHYFTSHSTLNAYAVIPKGPDVVSSLLLPHNRDQLFPHKK